MMREFEIERQFDIQIESIKPNKGVYLLKTDKGIRCLKKVDYGTQKLLFIYGAKEHLIKNGFDCIDRYCLNKDGNPYALVNEDIYTLSEWIEGRECDFYSKDDLVKAAKNLAVLHNASKGYDPPDNSKLKSDLGRWPHLMEKRLRSFEKMRDMVRKKSNKTHFDYNYLSNVDFFKGFAVRALNVINNSNYQDICKQTEEDKLFCHHDYTYHNIIIDNNDNVNVIDFDYCKREVRTYDISTFITKVLKRVDWNIEYADLILEAYSEVSPLSKDEYRLLYAFLVFPQRFWKLANRYYYNEISWNQGTFDKKMQELVDDEKKYTKFIDDFKEKYNQTE